MKLTRAPRRVWIYRVSRPYRKGRARLIAGVDFDHPEASNVMGYLRSAYFRRGKKVRPYPEFWLSLEEMDKLGVLLVLSARFWAKTREKGTSVSRREVEEFRRFWETLESQWPKIRLA